MATARPRPQVMRLTEAAADRIKEIDGEGRPADRGRARRRQERRLRRHGIHHGICRAASIRSTRWSRTRACSS